MKEREERETKEEAQSLKKPAETSSAKTRTMAQSANTENKVEYAEVDMEPLF